MIIFLDTETTGLYPGNICQLSYIIKDGNEVSAKNFFFTVGYVEAGAYAVHGFSTGDLFCLSEGKRFADYISEIENDFKKADFLVSHNTSFDFMFLREEFIRSGKILPVNGEFCSMKNSVGLCKLPRRNGAGYKYPKLSELCEFYDITDNEISKKCAKIFNEKVGFHDARFDTTALFLAVDKGIERGEYPQLKDF